MLAPTPPSEPFFGHARILARDPLRTLVRWMDTCGPVVRFRIGSREAHVVFGTDGIRRVLSDPDGIYGKETHGYRTLRLFVGNGLLTNEGATWEQQRRVLLPAFHRQSVARHVTMMGEVAGRWAERLAASREPVRIDEIAMRATLEIVSRALFGSDLPGSGAEVASAITDLQVSANRRISAAFTVPFAVPTPEHLRIRRARRTLRRILERLVEGRRRTSRDGEEHDVIDLLLAARDEVTGAPLSRELILDELITLLIAGHESTANALTWALLLLARHPAELALLRTDLRVGVSGEALGIETLGKLPRLRAVVDETLRLFPPAWSFGRAPRRDDELQGYSVPAGKLVMLVPWATHRDRALFAHPETFAPSRFLEASPPPFSYLPFGGGPRTCIGHTFARIELQILLATWLRALDFEVAAGQDLEPVPLITLRPRNGAVLRVTRRSP